MSPIIIPGSGSAMTFVELQDAVLFNTLGERYRASAKVWLNDGVRDACRRLRLQKTACVGTTDANGTLTLATTFWRILQVYSMPLATATGSTSVATIEQTGDQRLAPIPAASAGTDTPTTGRSWGYEAVISGGVVTVRVAPAPLAASRVAVIGYGFPTAMSADSDSSGLTGDLDEALVAFARARGFRREDDLQMAAMWEQEYTTRLRAVLPAVVSNQDGPMVTPGTDGVGDPWTGGG